MYKLESFDPQYFIQQHWQKRPMLIKQGLQNFVDPIDQDELAGLAMEDEIDSRIISVNNNKWNVHQGPFEQYEDICQGEWSLLVQGVDRYNELASQLLSAFNFVPCWRIEDLMVSFSVAGGGVGPHLDQYDVFIIQGKGTRRWKVGERGQYAETLPHPKLKQIDTFIPIIDEVLEAGDILYIPPGCPHEGIALEECLNYSVGFRAPNQQELLSNFADYALDNSIFNQRYSDPDVENRTYQSEIKLQEIEKFRDLFAKMISSDHFTDWLTRYLSLPVDNDEVLLEDTEYFSVEEVQQMIESKTCFEKRLGLKFILIEPKNQTVAECHLVIQGILFKVPIDDIKTVDRFLNSAEWTAKPKISYENSLFFNRFLITLVQRGWWYPK
jgi:50S ribosomal protein L16 3-hydroxylase